MSTTAPLSLGIDIGGTFTDLVIHDPRDGRAVIWKESTTPDDPARGAIEGTRKVLAKAGATPDQVGRVVHATTLFTNALIERKGAKTGLLTTAGFRDVLEIGRERKYELYDLFIEMPKPLVPRPWRREAMERLAPEGSVEKKLDIDAALAEVAALVKEGIESLAICFLHAYANPAHEAAAGALLRRHAPDLFVTLSHEILREFREYERTSTTALNAYVEDMEALAIQLGANIEDISTARPVPLDTPPFHAYPIISANTFTLGGLKVNAQAQVVDRDGVALPGLYAAGETMGIYYGRYAGATSVLRGAVFGRKAGEHAAALDRARQR